MLRSAGKREMIRDMTSRNAGLRFAGSSCALLAAFVGSVALRAATAEPTILADGVAVEGRLSGGESHRFQVNLAAGDYLRIRVEQRGVDVVLRLEGSDEPAREVDGMNGAWGFEVLSLFSATAASAVFEVRAGSGRAPAGDYVLDVEAGPAGGTDRVRLAADLAIETGYRHFRHQDAESLARALKAYQDAHRRWQELGDQDRQAEALYGIGVCQRLLHRGEPALHAFEQALGIFDARSDRHAVARTVNQIGRLHSSRGELEAALASFRRALALQRALGDVAGEAQGLINVGSMVYRIGDVHQAVDYYLRARELVRQLGDDRQEMEVEGNLASAYERLGEVQLALDLHHRVLARARKFGDLRRQARTLINLGYLHRAIDEPQEALTYYQAALDVCSQVGDRSLESATLNNMGFLYRHLGQPSRGLELLESALDAKRQIGDRDGEATTLTQIGEVRAELGELDSARDALREALAIRLEIGDRDGEAVTRAALGAAEARLGDRGLDQLSRALEIQRQQQNRRRESETLLRIGEVYAGTGKLDQAFTAYADSLAIRQALDDGRGTAEVFHAIASAEVSRGQLQAARGHLESALIEIESSRARVLDPDLRTTYFGSQQSIHELYVEVLMDLARAEADPGLERSALEASEKARARTLIDLLAETHSTVRRGIDAGLAERRLQLTRRLNAKAALVTLGGSRVADRAALQRDIQTLIDDLRVVDVEIRRLHPQYMSLLEPPDVDTGDIQRSLSDGTMLLEYALGTRSSFLWAVTSEKLKSFALPPREEIEDLARAAYEEISRLATGTRQQSCRHLAELGRLLLGPVAGELGDRRLVIVPDGILHYLPFAAFGDPRHGDALDPCRQPPLVERHEISTLPSAAALLELRSRLRDRPPAPLGIAILADPVFSSDDLRILEPASSTADPPRSETEARAEAGGFDLERLPWSRREAQAIADRAGDGVFQALDFAANRQLAANLGDYRIIHFATHGLLDNRFPELSGLVLSLVDQKGRFEDGFLRLHDIYNLDLDAELVVLSGCRTALGREIRGEGLVGLTRGFLYAGAARVLASLWRIDDQATAELMGDFYEALLHGGVSPAAALRQAQQRMRSEVRWRHPYYWAGFSLQGEWQPMVKE